MQVFKPEEMKEAYRKLFNSEPANVQQARARVAAFFRYNVKPVIDDEVDKTETALPKDSTSLSTPESTELSTHTEDVDEELMAQQFIDDVNDSLDTIKEMDAIQEEIKPKQDAKKRNAKTKKENDGK